MAWEQVKRLNSPGVLRCAPLTEMGQEEIVLHSERKRAEIQFPEVPSRWYKRPHVLGLHGLNPHFPRKSKSGDTCNRRLGEEPQVMLPGTLSVCTDANRTGPPGRIRKRLHDLVWDRSQGPALFPLCIWA